MSDSGTTGQLLAPGTRLGRHVIVRLLGWGGMGVVYVARDERLQRDVALKLLDGLASDATEERFWREARTAASVSHPNICPVYEIEETPHGLALAMELLTGEALDARLARGALPPEQATRIAREVLEALAALHGRGLVHRDIKPSNIFCTPHGAKVLDFGLARTVTGGFASAQGGADTVTRTGVVMGTPRYMAPEQLTGEALDGRTDLYAIGAVLFEMLAGRPPFAGATPLDQMYATMHERPPALQGPPFVVAVDRVIRRAMEKAPADRYPDAAAMAAELSAVTVPSGSGPAVPVRALIRVVVPPIRQGRPDAESSFLSWGLADAISGALAALNDVVVRSPSVAAAWAEPGADPRKLAAEADVDFVVAGTFNRAGPQLRATVQLIEAASGTVLGASNVGGSMDDIFAFEDALVQAVLALLAPRRATSSGEVEVARRDVPANGLAFEKFLRGMELARALEGAPQACALFEEAVEADPLFAPAWAALGRCRRVLAKYFHGAAGAGTPRESEDAFRRALALSPDLPMAHRWLTHLEAEQGRADVAVARLLAHAKVNRNDALLFAGLVHACRYAGLVEASLAAHAEARRLDPTVPTSVEYSYLQAGDADRLRAMLAPEAGPVRGDALFALLALAGADPVALAAWERIDLDRLPPAYRVTLQSAHAAAVEPASASVPRLEQLLGTYDDPEASYLVALCHARIGSTARAASIIADVVRRGYVPAAVLAATPALEAVRATPGWAAVEAEAGRRHALATAIFERGNGRELLGLPALASR